MSEGAVETYLDAPEKHDNSIVKLIIRSFSDIFICKERAFERRNLAEMKPKKKLNGPVQSAMFKLFLKEIISDEHSLVKLASLFR